MVEQLQEVMAVDPDHAFERMAATEDAEGNIVMEMEPVPTRTVDVNERIQANLPETIEPTGDQGYTLLDVYNGDISMEEFVAQLPLEDVALSVPRRGHEQPEGHPGHGFRVRRFDGQPQGVRYPDRVLCRRTVRHPYG